MLADSFVGACDDGCDGKDSVALSRFREVAIEWAVGARGRQIVDAATLALAEGLDSPSLRMLAGVPHAFAGEEAPDLAPLAFRELGLEVHTRLSSVAYVDGPRQEARRLLSGEISERELARRVARSALRLAIRRNLSTWVASTTTTS